MKNLGLVKIICNLEDKLTNGTLRETEISALLQKNDDLKEISASAIKDIKLQLEAKAAEEVAKTKRKFSSLSRTS